MDQKDVKHGERQDPSDPKKEESYRDDAPELVDSSDYAQGNDVGHYSGGGPDSTTEAAPRPKGSQDWQQGITAANDPSETTPGATADDPANGVASRSADRGQSSYGGFKNEGPSEQATHATEADAKRD